MPETAPTRERMLAALAIAVVLTASAIAGRLDLDDALRAEYAAKLAGAEQARHAGSNAGQICHPPEPGR